MKVTITIHCDNAAFFDGEERGAAGGVELSRILGDLGHKCHSADIEDLDGMRIMDSNGNKVGSLEVEE